MKQMILIVICLVASSFQNSRQINKQFEIMYTRDIYNTMNKLLSYLKVDNFTNLINIKLMLMINFYYYEKAGNNNKIYEELIKACAVNSTRYNTNLEKVLNDIMKEGMEKIENKIVTVTNLISEPEVGFNKTDSDYILTLDEFNDLWSKLSDRTIESLIDPILNEPENSDHLKSNSNYTSNKRDIKVWKPTTSYIQSYSKQNNTRRIYKGKKAKIKNYPFLVSIHINEEFMCAGSIISKDMVITAASCLQTAYNNKLNVGNPRNIFVRVASDYTKLFGELIPVVNVFMHQQYNPVTLRNNVAIIKLKENINRIKKRKIKRIKYDKRAGPLTDKDTEVTILGWGAKDENHLKSSNYQRLAFADLDIYDINDCKEVYSRYYVTDSNFCAGFTYKGGGACMGDVGGPAVISGELVGLISFGPAKCGLPDAPTVFTKIGFYAEWIDDILTQKPVLRQKEFKPTTSTKSPKLFILPLYTTIAPNTKLVKSTTKNNIRISTIDYPEEVQFLKKIIQEYILTNSSVVDYLLNGDILEDDENINETTENRFFNSNPSIKNAKKIAHLTQTYKSIYKTTTPPKTTKTFKTKASAIKILREMKISSPSKFIRSTSKTVYDDREDLNKKTTLRAVYDSSECSEENENVDINEDILGSNAVSSYYEEEIPIDITNFERDDQAEVINLVSEDKKDDSIQLIKQPTSSAATTTLQNRWSKVTKIVKNNKLKENLLITTTIRTLKENMKPKLVQLFESSIKEEDNIYAGINSEEVSTTILASFPQGVAMPISDEDFDYMNERNRQKSSNDRFRKRDDLV